MNAIVTTTINPPTKALLKFHEFAKKNNWVLVVVGDKKTPGDLYDAMRDDHLVYLEPAWQEMRYPELSDLIGWNCIQRRNFGFLWALEAGAEIIATVDDDNIPYKIWGTDIFVGRTARVDTWDTGKEIFDPLFHSPEFWHRGYPIQLLDDSKIEPQHRSVESREILVQADLWDGEPDIDAICRIVRTWDGRIPVEYRHKDIYTGREMGPFNSQNTYLSRKVFPTYFLFPHVGRMDDIWASYVTQAKFPNSVVYGPATVFQERNPHDLAKDLEAEMLGYKHNLELVRRLKDPSLGDWQEFLPDKARVAYEIYKKEVNKIIGKE